MSDWLTAPVQWTADHQSLLLQPTFGPTPNVTLEEITKKSATFPIKFPIDTPRCCQLKTKTSVETLERNINSVYPIIHEYGLYLCSIFLLCQRKSGSEFYGKMSLLDLIDRLLNKRAVTFMERTDVYMLVNGVKGVGNWESIGTEREKKPLVLEDCLSYDEIKLSALLSVSSYSFFLNDGDRYNSGKYEENREKVEDNGVIVGLIGARFEKPNVMEYSEILKTKEQNNARNGYGDGSTLQSQFLKFYGGSYQTYEDLEEEMTNSDRYIDIGSGRYFDKLVYEKRLALSIDTLLLESNDRAQKASKKAYIHVVGIGLGVWRLYKEQNKLFMETFVHRLELLSDVLTHISDIRFAYIRENTAGKYKNGDKLNGITLHIDNRNPQEKLNDDAKLLVVSYAWDGNALPGNEFWIGKLTGSGDPAAACSSQIAELHNGHINGKVSGGNLRVATSKGVVGFQEYQEMHRG